MSQPHFKRRHPVDLPDLERMVLTIRNTVGDPDHKPTKIWGYCREKQGIQPTHDGISPSILFVTPSFPTEIQFFGIL